MKPFICLRSLIVLTTITSALGLSFSSSTEAKTRGYKGSTALLFKSRFFDDALLGQGGFADEMAMGGEAQFGVTEFQFDLGPLRPSVEPLIWIEFGRNSNRQGTDEYRFELYQFGAGARYKAWEPHFFAAIPFLDAGLNYGLIRFRRVSNGTAEKIQVGSDLGAKLGGGVIFSFFTDKETAADMRDTWDLKDFGLMVSAHLLPSGLMKSGLTTISKTGGWDMGAGLFLDW